MVSLRHHHRHVTGFLGPEDIQANISKQVIAVSAAPTFKCMRMHTLSSFFIFRGPILRLSFLEDPRT